MQAVKEKSLPYCNDPEQYDFKWSGIEHNDFDCAYVDPASLFVNGESQVSHSSQRSHTEAVVVVAVVDRSS